MTLLFTDLGVLTPAAVSDELIQLCALNCCTAPLLLPAHHTLPDTLVAADCADDDCKLATCCLQVLVRLYAQRLDTHNLLLPGLHFWPLLDFRRISRHLSSHLARVQYMCVDLCKAVSALLLNNCVPSIDKFSTVATTRIVLPGNVCPP